MKIKINMLNLFTWSFLIIILTCCAEGPRNRSSRPDPDRSATQGSVTGLSGQIDQPETGTVFATGDDINISVSFDDTDKMVTSAMLTVDGREAPFSGQLPGDLVWNSAGQPVGTRNISVVVGFNDQTTETYSLQITLHSNIIPEEFSFRIVNSFPHDIRAFTQGLVFDSGFLYESTGQYGQSTLRKVELETGQVLRSLSLDRELFGEGLCVHEGKLYQLTWKSRVGFIYDKETFRLLNRVYYDSEGWGLTSDGTNLLKSDGSHIIFILDPQYFSEVGRIEVFDNNGKINNLNELEFRNGLIYANVYGTDEIVRIDRQTGRVTGKIDLTGLLDRKYHHPRLDVLNGIAYDHANDRLFVTGKNWPRLFEIELVAK
jgi:glutaminyl-peptide cyclotransferase